MDKYVSASKFKAKVISGEPVLFSEPTQHEIFFLLELEPSEDVEPVTHAHWYFDPDKSIGCGITVSGMFCSNCGGDCPTGSHPYRDFKYCPHCGAKMDEEEGKHD